MVKRSFLALQKKYRGLCKVSTEAQSDTHSVGGLVLKVKVPNCGSSSPLCGCLLHTPISLSMIFILFIYLSIPYFILFNPPSAHVSVKGK